MANWGLPILTSLYADFIDELKQRDDDCATMFDVGTPSTIPTGAIKWNSTSNIFEKWSGTVWNPLSTKYLINVDQVDGYHASAYNVFTANALVTRHPSGYIYSNSFNTTAASTATVPSTIFIETASDGFIRKQTLANFKTHIGIINTATATVPTHIWIETGSDGIIRKQTFAQFKTNIGIVNVATATVPTHIWIETGSDGIIRKQTLANFKTNIGIVNAATTATPTSVWVETASDGVIRKQALSVFNSFSAPEMIFSTPYAVGSTHSLVATVRGMARVNHSSSTGDTDIAVLNGSASTISSLRYRGDSSWLTLSGSLATGTLGNAAMTALNETDMAVISVGLNALRAYRVTGSTWATLGSALTISGMTNPKIAALTSSTVAIVDATAGLGQIRTYSFNGTIWSQVGSSFIYSGTQNGIALALNSTDIAVVDSSADTLTAFRFNGSTWSQQGTAFAFSPWASVASSFAGVTIAENKIVVWESIFANLACFKFDGSNFTVEAYNRVGGGGAGAMALINDTDIVYHESTNDIIKPYRFGFSIGTNRFIP